jgi:signal transduction histidine kinase
MVRGGLCVAAVAIVVVGERAAGFSGVVAPLADAAAGAAFLAAGIAALPSSRRLAVIAYGAGVAWFAANVIGAVLWVHRPLMLYAAYAYPAARKLGPWSRAVLAVWWIAAVVPSLARSPVVSFAVSAAALAVAWSNARRSSLGQRSSARTAAASATAVASAIALSSAVRLLALHGVQLLSPDIALSPEIVYAAAITVGGLVLLVRLLEPRGSTDLIIDLTQDDPGRTVAKLRAEVAATDDAATRTTLSAAIDLLEENERLHNQLEARIEDVRASRRRLVAAGINERSRLERRLADGAIGYLDELTAVLGHLHDQADLCSLVDQSLAEVEDTRADLAQLARGLHPVALVEHGLAGALADLATRSPIPISLRVPDGRLPELVEATIWYGCAEAVTNIGKYAGATAARIDVDLDRRGVTATVADDGVGGADTTPRGGLAGLADRLGAVDGTLQVHSPTGAGTRIMMWAPL